MDYKKIILENPKKAAFFLHIYNNLLGANRIKIKRGNALTIRSAKLNSTKILVDGINNKIFIGDLCRLSNCSIYIKGNNNVICLSERTSFVQTEFHIEDDNNEINIGVHTSVSGKTHFAAIEGTKIIIGEDCMLSSDIHFRTGDSHSIVDLSAKRINPSEDIIIGNHVWIGAKVTCLKGVFIPNNSIVGTGALLTRKFDGENSIYAGTPAKLIKSNINWLRERIK